MGSSASEKSNLTNLPSYKNPPINEVVCGLRFNTPKNLKIHHVGLLWNKFRTEYPNVEHALPIMTPNVPIGIPGLILPRVWFINKNDDQLVQFQIDRFYFNWRRKKEDYPRFTYVINKFEETFNTFESFFKEYELGDLTPIEYELSYINHILIGEGWDKIEDLNKIFPNFIFEKPSYNYLSNPSDVFINIVYPFKEGLGNLIISIKRGIRIDDKRELLIVEMKATGEAGSIDKREYLKWYNIAHESIVRSFTDITSSEIHLIWQREK